MIAMTHQQWLSQQKLAEEAEQRASHERNSRARKFMGEELSKMRWELSGPQEDHARWLRYCGEHGIVVKKSETMSSKFDRNRRDWEKWMDFEPIHIDQTDETLLVPKEFILKCLALEDIPPETQVSEDE